MSSPIPPAPAPPQAQLKMGVSPLADCAPGTCVPLHDDDPDGIVICRACGRLLYYHDIGGDG